MPSFIVTMRGPYKFLQAYTKEAEELMQKLEERDVVDIEVLSPRSTKFNAFVHVVIDKLAKANGIDSRSMKTQLLIATHRFDIVKVSGTKRVLVLHSTHRRSMSERELHKFWDEAVVIIREKLLPRLPNGDALEIRQMIDGEVVHGEHVD